MKKIKFLLVLWLCKFINFIVPLVRKNGGSMIAGKIAVLLNKAFIKGFTNIDYNKVIFITGTNGKSTTNNIIAHTMESSGIKVASNREGANLMSGIATTLIKNSNLSGKFNKEMLVLEVDERILPKVHKFLPAKHLCITNIQKDQMQRNGEPDLIYQLIKSAIQDDMTIYVNNEDPRAKSLGSFVKNTIYYSIDKNDRTFKKEGFYVITMPCPICNHRLNFNYYNVDNIGDYECSNCGYKVNSNVEFTAKKIDYKNGTFICQGKKYKVPYAEPHFIYNFTACIAVCKQFGISEKAIANAFANFTNVSGRTDTIKYKTKEIKYMKLKTENPETIQYSINYAAMDKQNKIIIFALEELAEFLPFTNTFYAYDCDFQKLIDSNVERYICSSKAVAYDAANVLIYAGVPKDKISILPTDDDGAICEELDKCDINDVYLLTWSGKYKRLKEYIKKSV